MLTNHAIHIFSVSKNKNNFIDEAVNHYSKNILKFCSVKWHFLRESKSLDKNKILADEANFILNAIENLKDSYVICLDENGKLYNSVSFSKQLQKWMEFKIKLSIVIGGPYGISDTVKKLANECISLSMLTFDHQMVRIILAEQLYRALSIIHKTKYHN